MKMLKNVLSILLVSVFACGVLCIPVSAASAQKAYTISNSNTRVYSDASLKSGSGWIFGSDEVTILSIGNKSTYVRYPVSRGTRTGYVETNKILVATSGNSYTAKSKITTYRRPNGNTYGYISANDPVVVLGKYGNYTQIKYPVSGGYKYAFVTTSDADRFIIGNNSSTMEGTYVIRSALNTNKVMDAYGNGSIQNGTNLQLCGFHGGDNQIYTLYHVGDGYYKITCKWGGKCVVILNGSRENGANVILHDYNGTDNEKWRVVPAGDGSYYLQSKLNGNCLDVWGGRTEDETNIQSFQPHGGPNQRWWLTPVGNGNNQNSTASSLHSPIATGAKFSKKTNDNGWFGYHDINRNVSSNTPVYAITDGTAYFYQYHTNGKLRSYGNYIKFVSNDGKYEVRYAHLNRFNGINTPITTSAKYPCSGAATKAYIGSQKVSAGQTLGWVGTTGNSSGIHLHLEIYKNGVRIDPTSIFAGLI